MPQSSFFFLPGNGHAAYIRACGSFIELPVSLVVQQSRTFLKNAHCQNESHFPVLKGGVGWGWAGKSPQQAQLDKQVRPLSLPYFSPNMGVLFFFCHCWNVYLMPPRCIHIFKTAFERTFLKTKVHVLALNLWLRHELKMEVDWRWSLDH